MKKAILTLAIVILLAGGTAAWAARGQGVPGYGYHRGYGAGVSGQGYGHGPGAWNGRGMMPGPKAGSMNNSETGVMRNRIFEHRSQGQGTAQLRRQMSERRLDYIQKYNNGDRINPWGVN